MRYIEIETGKPIPKSSYPWWVRAIRLILPEDNPDLEPLHQEAVRWWLELDADHEPEREIGFDAAGQAIVLGPVRGNPGFLLPVDNDWEAWEETSEEATENFQRVWNELWPHFAALEEGRG